MPDEPPHPVATPPFVFDLDGGRPCLDFANTRTSSAEHLTAYADLLAFSAQSDLLTPSDTDWLHAQASRDPAAAQDVVRRARLLREAMRDIFSSLAAAQTPPRSALDVLNDALADSLGHAQVLPSDTDGGYAWGWRHPSLDLPLWPLCRSAADVLVNPDERRLVRQCGAADCAWLFVDTTRNRSRQWCSMQSCGNREKARRHYQRVRANREAKP